MQERQNEWWTTEKGKHLHKIDDGLPSDTCRNSTDPIEKQSILGSAPNRAFMASLTCKDLQTREEDKCICGARETVVHVLVDSPNLRELRQELRSKIGDAFNDMAIMLGGRP